MIFISSATWHEVTDKIDFSPIQELLDQFDAARYSQQVKGLNFFYLCLDEPSEDLQDEIEFDGEYINVYRLLDYGEVLEMEQASHFIRHLHRIDRFRIYACHESREAVRSALHGS